MIAATIPNVTPWWHHLAFNWFDLALVGILVFGYFRGRKRGMTKEMIPTIEWLAILLVAGFGHIFLADWLQHQGYVRKVFGNHFNERTAALLSSYLVIFFFLFVIFAAVKRKY